MPGMETTWAPWMETTGAGGTGVPRINEIASSASIIGTAVYGVNAGDTQKNM